MRVPKVEQDRWRREADLAGVTLTELIRGRMNASQVQAAPAAPQPAKTASSNGTPAAQPRKAVQKAAGAAVRARTPVGGHTGTARGRTGICEHRVPPNAYCKRCDR